MISDAQGSGIGDALSSWLIERALATGASFVHLSPDNDLATSLYAQVGFVGVPGLDVYVLA